MSRVHVAALACLLLLAGSVPARADATLFLGSTTTPENRRAQGFAIGAGLLLVGFEFEYASTSEETDLLGAAPSLKTGSGNVLLQTPFAIFGFQPYFTTGAGMYHEEMNSRSQTGFALNTGGGVKISLAGPIRLRIDYRVFKLGDDALSSPSQRVYAGLNLKF